VRAGREDGEAAQAVERRADDPADGDRIVRVLAKIERGLELAVLLDDRLGLRPGPRRCR
jgi:hypothetical protein